MFSFDLFFALNIFLFPILTLVKNILKENIISLFIFCYSNDFSVICKPSNSYFNTLTLLDKTVPKVFTLSLSLPNSFKNENILMNLSWIRLDIFALLDHCFNRPSFWASANCFRQAKRLFFLSHSLSHTHTLLSLTHTSAL